MSRILRKAFSELTFSLAGSRRISRHELHPEPFSRAAEVWACGHPAYFRFETVETRQTQTVLPAIRV
jgi:hypothetical protein